MSVSEMLLIIESSSWVLFSSSCRRTWPFWSRLYVSVSTVIWLNVIVIVIVSTIIWIYDYHNCEDDYMMSDILQETLTDVCVEKVKWLIMTLKNLPFLPQETLGIWRWKPLGSSQVAPLRSPAKVCCSTLLAYNYLHQHRFTTLYLIKLIWQAKLFR